MSVIVERGESYDAVHRYTGVLHRSSLPLISALAVRPAFIPNPSEERPFEELVGTLCTDLISVTLHMVTPV
jgi:hypothetical protein